MKAGPIATCLVSVTLAAAAEPSRKAQPEPVDMGSRLELFVDGHLIESLKGARLKLHSPRPAERVLFFDREWEGGEQRLRHRVPGRWPLPHVLPGRQLQGIRGPFPFEAG